MAVMVKKKRIKWRFLDLFMGCCGAKNMTYDEEQSVSEHAMRDKRSFRRLSLSDISDPSSPMSVADDLSNTFRCHKIHVFTLMELSVITHCFTRSNMLGEGGFGPVYKGFVDHKLRPGLEAQPVAVKALDLYGLQGHREWLAEIIFLGQLRHKHLVKLIGFCCEEEQRLLVYEYMPRGSLANHLFRRSCSVTLAWSTRMKIALGAAKGLAFLHQAEKSVIYRDFKTSNILLDSNFNAKLSDFGLAKDGPEGEATHVTTRVMGTQGYAAPEYIMTGHLTTMSDVYSFGVVLLELITGKRSMDNTRPRREQSLVEWARPILKDPRKLDRIMDPKLEGLYSTKEAQVAAQLAHKCLRHRAKHRPTMNDVVRVLESIQFLQETEKGKNEEDTYVCVVPNHNGKNAKKCLDKRKVKYSYKCHRHVDVACSDSLCFYKIWEESGRKNYRHLMKKKKITNETR